MPKFLETKLRAEVAAQGKTGRAADRYVFGAMNNMGAMHGSKETAKGAAMDVKHARDTARPMHPKMVARAAATKAAHAHLARTVPGFRQLPGREQIARTHAHVSRGGR